MSAHKVIELLDEIIAKNVDGSMVAICKFIAEKIKIATKIHFDTDILPKFSEEFTKELLGRVRLPFPCCYFEINDLGAIIAQECGDPVDRIMFQAFPLTADGFTMINPKLLLGIDLQDKGISTWATDDQTIKDFEELNSLAESYGEYENERSIEKAFLVRGVFGIPLFVMYGIDVLNCSNVVTVDNPPPEALNRKRLKNGKPPVYTYKTLHIVKPRNEANSSVMPCSPCGRLGPRLHLRRGHIRRLPGKQVWVSSCMVGEKSRGSVKKDYAVHIV